MARIIEFYIPENYRPKARPVVPITRGSAAPHLEWTPKAYHEREISAPKRLLDSLKSSIRDAVPRNSD